MHTQRIRLFAASLFLLLGCEHARLPADPAVEPSPLDRSPIAGAYTLTVRANSACGFPAEARVRTYSAQIDGASAQTPFSVSLRGAEFFSNFNYVTITTVGNSTSFSMSLPGEPTISSNPGIVEKLPGQGYLSIDGSAKGTLDASGGVSAPFDGILEYCPGDVAWDGKHVSCLANGALTCYSSESAFHELTLLPR